MKCEWKKIAAMCAFALCIAPMVASAEMPRSEWHAKVSDCVQDAQVLKDTISQLSASDQTAFLAEVNDAISKMPGSDDVKGAKFYAANRAAVTGATKDNRAAVLAEVFATVPPEYLTDINERFATELFNRNANPSKTFTDDEFVGIATNTMATIVARCEKEENAGVRETFAALMFLRASGGTPANLAETLVSQFPDAKTREMALNEWIKPAMGDGQEQSYDPMLGAAQAGEEPDHAVVTQIVWAEQSTALLADLQTPAGEAVSAKGLAGGFFSSPAIVGAVPNEDQADIGLNRIPRGAILSKTKDGDDNPYYTRKRGDQPGSSGTEPSPYYDQK